MQSQAANRRSSSTPCCDPLEGRVLLAAALVKDINTLTPSSGPNTFVDLNGTLLFRANDGVGGEDWWRSDGTPQGTRRVKDMDPPASAGAGAPGPRTVAVVGETLFFRGYGRDTGWELWKTDGTDAGTVLVKDITAGTGSSSPGWFVAVGDALYFATQGPGERLWKSDGTAAGTVLVGTFGGPIRTLAAVGGKVVFQARGPGATGGELWATDGTADGTVFLKDINPGNAGSEPGTLPANAVVDALPLDQFHVTGSRMYFAATDVAHGRELWQTDGTPDGTRLVVDAVPGPTGSFPGFIAEHDGAIFFSAQVANTFQVDLYRVAADGAGASLVHTLPTGRPLALDSTGEDLFCVTYGPLGAAVLFVLDASGAAVTELKQFPTSTRSAAPDFFRLGGTTYFGVGSGITAGFPTFQLWRTDGTAARTQFVAGFVRVPSTQQPELLSVGGALYFAGSDGLGAEPWRSDGTPEGTRRLLDVRSAPSNPSNPTRPVEVNGRWLFSALGNHGGTDLWVTDGTDSGTRRLVSPVTGSGFSVSPELVERTGTGGPGYSVGTVWNGRLYFTNGGGRPGLWSSDGTPEGTGAVSELYPGVGGVPYNFTPFNGRLFFAASHARGLENALWSTDGTAAGTRPVKAVRAIRDATFTPLTVAGDALYFSADDGTTGYEPWKSDGTEAGTTRVKDINPNSAASDPGPLTAYGGQVYFPASHFVHGRELWRSDGTAEGTVLFADLYPGGAPNQANSGRPVNLAVVNGRLLFEATDFGPVPEGGSYWRPGLWASDGTPDGTVRLTDPAFSPYQIAPFHLTDAGGAGYFFRQRRESPPEMWRTNGTPQGTSLVRVFDTAGFPPFATPVGKNGPTLYVRAGEGVYGWAPAPSGASERWQSDGTAAGTVRLFSGGITAFPANATFANGRVLFTADDGVHGTELWSATSTRVAGRHVFYNNSFFDGGDTAAGAADDAAIAPDKAPLLDADGAATFANVTSYARGVNGIMLDVAGLPAGDALGPGDFQLHAGGAGAWSAAPAAAVSVRRGAGASGTDRVTLVLPDGTARNTWLRVTVFANDRTGLAEPDVFYVGNLVGETGDGGGVPAVTARDLLNVRARLGGASRTQAVDSRWDFNRDGRLNALDVALAKMNQSRALGAIPVAPVAAVAPPPPWRPWDERLGGPLA